MKNYIKNNIKAFALLTVGAIFIVIGTMRGEVAVVLRKAVNICLECIGIG